MKGNTAATTIHCVYMYVYTHTHIHVHPHVHSHTHNTPRPPLQKHNPTIPLTLSPPQKNTTPSTYLGGWVAASTPPALLSVADSAGGALTTTSGAFQSPSSALNCPSSVCSPLLVVVPRDSPPLKAGNSSTSAALSALRPGVVGDV